MTIKDKSKTFLASISAKLIGFNPYGIASLILADLIANGFSSDECLKKETGAGAPRY